LPRITKGFISHAPVGTEAGVEKRRFGTINYFSEKDHVTKGGELCL
jgi:hypothetical protein